MSINSFFRGLQSIISPTPSSSSTENPGEDERSCSVNINQLPVEVASSIFNFLSEKDVLSYGLTSQAARVQVILYANHRSKKALASLRKGSESFSKAVSVLKIVLGKRVDLLPILEAGDADVLLNCLDDLRVPSFSDQFFLPFLVQNEEEELDLSLAVSISNHFDFSRGLFSILHALDELDFLIKSEFERIRMPLNSSMIEELRALLVPLINRVCEHFSWKIAEGNIDELLESVSEDSLKKILENRFLETEPDRPGTTSHIFVERLYKFISLGLNWEAFLFVVKVFKISIPRMHPGVLERLLRSSLTRPDFVKQLLQLPVRMDPVLLGGEVYEAYPVYSCLNVFFLEDNEETLASAMSSCYEILTSRACCKQVCSGVFSHLFLSALINCKEATKTLLEKSLSVDLLKIPSSTHIHSVAIHHQGVRISLTDVVMRRYLSRFSSIFPHRFPLNAMGQLERNFLQASPFVSFSRLAALNLDLFAIRSLSRRGIMEPLEKPYVVGGLSITILADICFPLEPLRRESPREQGMMAHLLMENGANVNAIICGGTTILMLACRLCGWYSRAFFIQELLLYGADVNAVDDENNTALHYLAQSIPSEDLLGEYSMIFQLLLVENKTLNFRNGEGRTALEVAQFFGNNVFLDLAARDEGFLAEDAELD
ncbi:ankyrin repeat domain-containing protein [Chlamydiifrater volucris]|uniref:ankyrin repeat domain-containing protein n=1 Tax=Chlamydiifrater volucris TaxID=2681470 RepID=UPI001BCF766A|nr:hypothetical protein [Chlamydiifrater volucris]